MAIDVGSATHKPQHGNGVATVLQDKGKSQGSNGQATHTEEPFIVYKQLVNGSLLTDPDVWQQKYRLLRPQLGQIALALNSYNTCFNPHVSEKLSAELLEDLDVTAKVTPADQLKLNAEVSYRSRQLASSILLLIVEMYSLNDRLAVGDLARLRNQLLERTQGSVVLRNGVDARAKKFLDAHESDAGLILEHVRDGGYLLKKVLEQREASSSNGNGTDTASENGAPTFVDEVQGLSPDELRALQRIAEYDVPDVVEYLQVAASFVVRDIIVEVVPTDSAPVGWGFESDGGVVSAGAETENDFVPDVGSLAVSPDVSVAVA